MKKDKSKDMNNAKKNQQKKVNTKSVILSIVSFLLVIAITVPIVVFSIPKDPIINDNTSLGNTQAANADGVIEGTNDASINPNLNVFNTDDSKKVESAVTSVSMIDESLVLDMKKGSPLDSMEVGDVFLLQGDENSFLGEAYFGKIVSKIDQDDYYTYAVETPMFDEVFDSLDIDFTQELNYSNISEIHAAEGVTIRPTDDVTSEFASNNQSNASVVSSSYITHDKSNLTSPDQDIFIEFEVDILKALKDLGVIKANKKNTQESTNNNQNDENFNPIVYYTDTGVCYHRSTCHTLVKSKYPATVSEAKARKLKACLLCEPPTKEYSEDSDSDLTSEWEIKLSGKVGIENLAISVTSESGDAWNINDGFDNLAIKTEGTFKAEAGLSGNFKLELAGEDTKIEFDGWSDKALPLITIEGLKSKLFPIAFVSYNGSWNVTAGTNADKMTLPLTIGVMFYTDIQGNITAGAEVSVAYQRDFEFEFDIFKDGRFLGIGAEKDEENADNDASGVTDWKAAFEAKADVDVHVLGCSVMLYVGNMNLAELSLARVGAELQGGISYDFAKSDYEDNFLIEGSARIYLEILEFDLKMQSKSKWGLSTSVNANCGPLFKFDLAAFGHSSQSTYFDPSTMNVTNITANDRNTFYFKNESGNLIAQKGSDKTLIYSDDFFVLCGIDESFIYVVKQNNSDGSLYDIYRIKKDGTSDRVIFEGIRNLLEFDEQYIYFTTANDTSTVIRLDRSTLATENFISMGEEIAYAKKQGENFYVETISGWWLLTSIKYYLVNSLGEVIESYGENPRVQNMLLYEYDDYYAAVKIYSNGFLRDTASELYWLSKDKQTYIKAESQNGWNPTEKEGVFVITEGNDEYHYMLKLYKASDGTLIPITGVNSANAHFTLVQDEFGYWYFIDETETDLVLYSMNKSFGNIKELERFSKDEFPVNLGSCAMLLIDGTIWFYEMPDEYTANVLYRYNLH